MTRTAEPFSWRISITDELRAGVCGFVVTERSYICIAG